MLTKVTISLTDGNLRNGHIYWRTALDMLPEDVIGGSNAEHSALRQLTVYFEGLDEPIETDIAGDKQILRDRAGCRKFFQLHRLQAGDQISIEKISKYAFLVRPLNGARSVTTTISIVEQIKDKFAQTGNAARIPLQNHSSFDATIADGGIKVSNLGSQPFLPWEVFQEAVCVLLRNGGSADRGDAMSAKLGDPELSLDSIEGHIAHVVYGKQIGDTVFRRIAPIASVLVWAGICEHKRRRLKLCVEKEDV